MSVRRDSGSSVDLCPYDDFPCYRNFCCEIKCKGLSTDVCSRFVLKSGVERFHIDFTSEYATQERTEHNVKLDSLE